MASHLHAQIACDQFWTCLLPPLVTKGCHPLPISNPNSTYFLKNTSSNPPRIPKGAKLVWQYVWSSPHNHKNIIATWIEWTLTSMKIREREIVLYKFYNNSTSFWPWHLQLTSFPTHKSPQASTFTTTCSSSYFQFYNPKLHEDLFGKS